VHRKEFGRPGSLRSEPDAVPKPVRGLFLSVFLGVSFPRFLRMLSGMNGMPSRRVSMMGGFFMLPAVVMLGRFAVMAGGIRMMFRGLPVVFSCVLGHAEKPSLCGDFLISP
jgi:hypothetical protein